MLEYALLWNNENCAIKNDDTLIIFDFLYTFTSGQISCKPNLDMNVVSYITISISGAAIIYSAFITTEFQFVIVCVAFGFALGNFRSIFLKMIITNLKLNFSIVCCIKSSGFCRHVWAGKPFQLFRPEHAVSVFGIVHSDTYSRYTL